VWRALKYFCPERVVDKYATRAEKENNKAQTHMKFCEVMMVMSLIYNPWVLHRGWRCRGSSCRE
jgi:hypothetical protein